MKIILNDSHINIFTENYYFPGRSNLIELANQESVIRKYFDNCFYASFLLDKSGLIIYMNEKAEHVFKIAREDIIGKNKDDFESNSFESSTEIALNEQKLVTCIKYLSNDKVYIDTSIPIFNDSGKLEYILTMIRCLDDNTIQNACIIKNSNKDVIISRDLEKAISYDNRLVFRSKQTFDTLKLVEKVAVLDTTVLLLGESGVGKSSYARYLHRHSNRSSNRMVEINCGAIPETLLESELFGYESGAFSGAQPQGKKGLIEASDGGILFLDEIGDMPLSLQAKLLTVIQDRKIMKVGGINEIPVDTKIVAATNQDLKKLIEEGKFREDLYYRLNVLPIKIHPLRDRPGDIIPLAKYFLNKYNKKHSFETRIDEIVYEKLESYSWPGNVRELENLIERLVITSSNELVTLDNPHLSFTKTETPNHSVEVNKILPLREVIEEAERQLIKKTYSKYPSSYKLAEALNISQTLAYKKIAKYIEASERA